MRVQQPQLAHLAWLDLSSQAGQEYWHAMELMGRYAADNVCATQRLLEAAKGAEHLRRFVFASSSSVYGDAERFPTRETDRPQPVSPYGVTKLAAEHLCELYRGGFGVPTASPVCPTPPITSPAATRWPTCRWFVLPSVRCA